MIIIEPEPWLATEESRTLQAWTQQHDRSRIIQYHSVQGIYISKHSVLRQDVYTELLSSASYESQGLQGVVPGF